jgi:four helix bundle protein
MNSDLKVRTTEYALSVIRLFAELPKRTEAQVLGRQVLRSGTSVGAQYRKASRAKSNADFISKIEGSLQELEETEYWLELLGQAGLVPQERLAAVKNETGELKGIFISIVRNVKANRDFRNVSAPGPLVFLSSFILLPLSFYLWLNLEPRRKALTPSPVGDISFARDKVSNFPIQSSADTRRIEHALIRPALRAKWPNRLSKNLISGALYGGNPCHC